MTPPASLQNAISGLPLVKVDDVSKTYELHGSSGGRFLHQLLGRFSPVKPSSFAALSEISFSLQPGDAIAVLGRNGAGKSTLLQIVAGVLRPSRGTVRLPKRVIGLLELGSGFNPDFTGRENIEVNAAILGIGRAELAEKINDIIAFADIGDYMDQPVRTYSSGMFLRLAFGIATSVAPDLLLVDEVLAVGDVFFRQKCYERLNALRCAGTAVVLVTHSIGDASEFCSTGIVLSEGRLAYSGRAVDAVEYYITHEETARTGMREETGTCEQANTLLDDVPYEDGDWMKGIGTYNLSGRVQMGRVDLFQLECVRITDLKDRPKEIFEQGDWMRCRLAGLVKAGLDKTYLGITIRNARNIPSHAKNALNCVGDVPGPVSEGTIIEMTYNVKLDLECGEYSLEFGSAEICKSIWGVRSQTSASELLAEQRPLSRINSALSILIRPPSARKPSTVGHFGIADLPGQMETKAYTLRAATEAVS